VQTLTRGGTLEPNRDWAVVTNSYNELLRRRGSFSNDLWAIIENAFATLTQDLNAIADLFRRIAIAKGSPEFDERSYLDKANALINRARESFSLSLQRAADLTPAADSANLRPSPQAPTAGSAALVSTASNLPAGVAPQPFYPKTRFDKLIDWCKNNRWLLPLLIVGGIIIVIGNAIDSLDKTVKFYKTYVAPLVHTTAPQSPAGKPVERHDNSDR
jgi:hypothetical protein